MNNDTVIFFLRGPLEGETLTLAECDSLVVPTSGYVEVMAQGHRYLIADPEAKQVYAEYAVPEFEYTVVVDDQVSRSLNPAIRRLQRMREMAEAYGMGPEKILKHLYSSAVRDAMQKAFEEACRNVQAFAESLKVTTEQAQALVDGLKKTRADEDIEVERKLREYYRGGPVPFLSGLYGRGRDGFKKFYTHSDGRTEEVEVNVVKSSVKFTPCHEHCQCKECRMDRCQRVNRKSGRR